MRHKSLQYALLGQISLYGFLAVCLLLMPHFLFEANEGGVSNYGLYAKTILPYTLAFVLGGFFTVQAALSLPVGIDHYQALKLVIGTQGLLLVVLLFSTYPYKLSPAFNSAHQYTSVILALWQVSLGAWFAVFLTRSLKNIMILVIEIVGFFAGVLTYYGTIHVLFIAEMVTGMAFGALLVRTVAQLTEH